MGEDIDIRDEIEMYRAQRAPGYYEEPPERDCVTCRFERYRSSDYPCWECGIRSHYSSIHGR